MHKPYSEACDQNKVPILHVLRKEFADVRQVLEIGSGTGQHAVYFGTQLPHLIWQTSDVISYHAGIHAWLSDAALPGVLPPLALDVDNDSWPMEPMDAVFSANTTHIMSWPQVQKMFAGIGRVLVCGGVFCLYGPFNYGGTYTSPGNARFDAWLKTRDPASGVRDFEALDTLANINDMLLTHDYEMPVNNRTLVWRKVV